MFSNITLMETIDFFFLFVFAYLFITNVLLISLVYRAFLRLLENNEQGNQLIVHHLRQT